MKFAPGVLLLKATSHKIGSRFPAMVPRSAGLVRHPPSKEIQKRQFLKALNEPFWSSFALLDFTTVPLMEVINWALKWNHQNIDINLALFQGNAGSTSKGTPEESQFLKAIQCTYYLQFSHSNVNCI